MVKRSFLAVLVLAGACRTAPKKCPPEGAAPEPVSAILQQAKQADYDGNYQLALDITSDMVRFRGDREEAQAWAVRGSTYWLMGNKKKAKTAWKRAYDIDPCMKDVEAQLKKLDSGK